MGKEETIIGNLVGKYLLFLLELTLSIYYSIFMEEEGFNFGVSMNEKRHLIFIYKFPPLF